MWQWQHHLEHTIKTQRLWKHKATGDASGWLWKWFVMNMHHLKIACKELLSSYQPFKRNRQQMCTHLDQDYLQLYSTVHETDSSAVLFTGWWEKNQQSWLKEDSNRAFKNWRGEFNFIIFLILLWGCFFKGTSTMGKPRGRVLNRKKLFLLPLNLFLNFYFLASINHKHTLNLHKRPSHFSISQ